jgi:hypothetical protein
MRASSWRPGTFLVIGVWFGGLGDITERSVCGVNAKAGRPGSELSAGVVLGLAVVRSGLSKHVVSAAFTTWLLSRARSWSHLLAAMADVPVVRTAPKTSPTIQRASEPLDILDPPL